MQRDPITMMVAQNIEALMEQKGLDAAKLARTAGLNPTGIYDIISGKSRSPRIETIGKIAKGLGVPIAVLFSEDYQKTAHNELDRIIPQLSPDQQDLLARTALAWIASVSE